MLYAFAPGTKAKNLDDVLVYRKSVAAADEVSALLKRPIFRKDLEQQLENPRAAAGPQG
jgi:hypothetical protein